MGGPGKGLEWEVRRGTWGSREGRGSPGEGLGREWGPWRDVRVPVRGWRRVGGPEEDLGDPERHGILERDWGDRERTVRDLGLQPETGRSRERDPRVADGSAEGPRGPGRDPRGKGPRGSWGGSGKPRDPGTGGRVREVSDLWVLEEAVGTWRGAGSRGQTEEGLRDPVRGERQEGPWG